MNSFASPFQPRKRNIQHKTENSNKLTDNLLNQRFSNAHINFPTEMNKSHLALIKKHTFSNIMVIDEYYSPCIYLILNIQNECKEKINNFIGDFLMPIVKQELQKREFIYELVKSQIKNLPKNNNKKIEYDLLRDQLYEVEGINHSLTIEDAIYDAYRIEWNKYFLKSFYDRLYEGTNLKNLVDISHVQSIIFNTNKKDISKPKELHNIEYNYDRNNESSQEKENAVCVEILKNIMNTVRNHIFESNNIKNFITINLVANIPTN